MKSTKPHILFVISIISFLLMSLSFLLMPLDVMLDLKNSEWLVILSGVMFWLFLAVGIITQVILAKKIKNEMGNSRKAKPGVISFFNNKYAIVFDLSTVIGIIGIIVSFIATNQKGYACYVFIAITAFSFAMHTVLNGKSFNNLLCNRNKYIGKEGKEQ